MTEQTSSAPPTADPGYAPPPTGPLPPPAPRPPLRRTTGNQRVAGGVAAGIARWLGIDPVLVRVAFVVLAVFGGSGILLYLAGWLFIPEEGQAESSGERFFRDNTALAVVLGVVLALSLVGPVIAWGTWGHAPGVFGVLVTIAVVVLVVQLANRGSRTPPTPASSQPGPATVTAAATQVVPHPTDPSVPPPAPPAPPAGGPVLPPAPAPGPAPARERSVLGRLTVGVTLLVVGVMVSLDLAGVTSFGPVTVVAAALLVVALGLLVGTLVGRARGLIVLGVVLVAFLVPMAAVPNGLHATSGAGNRVYAPRDASTLAATYQLGAGQLTLDLRTLDLAGATDTVNVSVGAGQIIVLAPAGVNLVVDASTGVGQVAAPGVPQAGGFGVERSWTVTRAQTDGGLSLDLQVGLGQIDVRYPTTGTTVEVTS